MTLVAFALALFLYVALSFPAMKYIARELPSVLEDPDIVLSMSWPVGLFLVDHSKVDLGLGTIWHRVYCKLYPGGKENEKD